jgi:hypothetical protein
MKKILLIFTIILSINSFGQEPEDNDNFDSVTPIYFIDSVYIKYKITKLSIDRKVYDNPDTIAGMLYENDGIRVATDEDLSMLLSDSIARLYKASKEFDSDRQLNNVFNFIDNIAIDSNLNVLFVKVISPCQPCMNSIIDNIMSEKEMTKMLSNGKLKYVYVNYYQTTRNSRYEFIVITAKHWFRRKQIYTLYNEKL